MPTNDVWLAGVDGCAAGWIVALVRPTGNEFRVRVAANFIDVLAAEAPDIIVVDIPIGLPSYSGLHGRRPECVVRPLLGPRQSSLFRVPSRSAVYTGVDAAIANLRERYIAACAVARDTSVDKKAFSKQSFFLFPKIVHVDKILSAKKAFARRVFEAHPEFAFRQLNNGLPLGESKKTSAGIEMRRQLLIEAKLPERIVNEPVPLGACSDDLLDAVACAAIARRIHAGQARPFPDKPERDACGLPMAIWA